MILSYHQDSLSLGTDHSVTPIEMPESTQMAKIDINSNTMTQQRVQLIKTINNNNQYKSLVPTYIKHEALNQHNLYIPLEIIQYIILYICYVPDWEKQEEDEVEENLIAKSKNKKLMNILVYSMIHQMHNKLSFLLISQTSITHLIVYRRQTLSL